MKFKLLFTNVALIISLSACSAAQTYNSLQDFAIDGCNKGASADRAACLTRVSQGYDSYKRDREKVIH